MANGQAGMSGETAPGGGSGPERASEPRDPAAAAFQHAPAAMIAADPQGRITAANGAFTRATGYQIGHVRGRPWPTLMSLADAGFGWRLHQIALSRPTEAPRQLLRVTTRESGERSLVVVPRAVPGVDGSPEGVVVVLYHARHEEGALRAVASLRTESSDTAMWSLDLRTGELAELFGASALGQSLAGSEATLAQCLDRVHPDDVDRLRTAMDAVSEEERDHEQRFRMYDRMGDERWLRARARYLDGDRPRLVGIVNDVTEHVRLVRRLADRRRIEAAQGRQITELASKLVSAKTVNGICALLSEEFPPIFQGQSSGVLLTEHGRLTIQRTLHGRLAAIEVLDGHNTEDDSLPIGAALQDRQPRFFESRAEGVQRFPGVRPLLDGSLTQSWVVIPIVGDRRVALGVWVVAWQQPHHATPDERALMLTLAGLAGLALQRVNSQQAGLELADAVQRRMLPPALTDFAALDVAVRYLPARAGWQICGDFYDALELPGNRIGLVVGDVQGHGVEAAAAMGQIRVAFRAYASNLDDPGEVLAATNRLLIETGEIVFATCGYLVLDLETGEMSAAWAGQPPAVLATSRGYHLWAPETGPPVGVDPHAKYPVTVRRLDVAESLLMCSDGLVESAGVSMDDGLARTGRILSAHAGNVRMAAASLADAAPAGRSDDIAILIARRR